MTDLLSVPAGRQGDHLFSHAVLGGGDSQRSDAPHRLTRWPSSPLPTTFCQQGIN